jgi:hypothetical protein
MIILYYVSHSSRAPELTRGFLWDPCFSFFSVILCFVCLRYVSCVTNVASVGGLFISDCLSVFYVCLTLPPFNDSACTKLEEKQKTQDPEEKSTKKTNKDLQNIHKKLKI